jgi:ribosomal protein S25
LRFEKHFFCKFFISVLTPPKSPEKQTGRGFSFPVFCLFLLFFRPFISPNFTPVITKKFINMQTQILTLETLRPSVGQLAKTPLPTLKPLSDKEKAVGRHEKQNSHTSAHTHEQTCGEQSRTKQGFSKGFSVRFFLETADLLYSEVKTVFHNADYVASISEVYRKEDRELFFRLVRAFTALRKSARHQPIAGVFETNDEDFWAAFRIMKLRNQASKKKTYCKVGKKTVNKVLDYLQSHCPNKPFTSPEIAQKLKIQRRYATAILTHLHKQNAIELVHKQNRSGLRVFNLKQQEQ